MSDIKIELEMTTSIRYGGTTGTITMFTIEADITMSASDWIAFKNQGIIRGKGDLPPFKPRNPRQPDDDTVVFPGSLQISLENDSLEYYQKLVRQGWKPNTSQATAIRSFGYRNFYPENFK